jgi:hypothetical protein
VNRPGEELEEEEEEEEEEGGEEEDNWYSLDQGWNSLNS